jgi:hypothetical protein
MIGARTRQIRQGYYLIHRLSMFRTQNVLTPRMFLSVIAVLAISLVAGKHSVPIGIGLFSTGIFWCFGIAHRFAINPILLATSITLGVSLLGGIYGLLRSCFPYADENMLFGPISSFIFVLVVSAISSSAWLVASVIFWFVLFASLGRVGSG